MLKGHSLIYFAPEKWDGLWRNRQQLMSVFAEQNKVLFVEPRPHLRSTMSRYGRGQLEKADWGYSLVRPISEGLYLFRYPIWAATSGLFPIGRITLELRRSLLAKALKDLHMSEPIVWFSRPGMVTLFNEIPATPFTIYHVVDEYSAYHNKSSKTSQRLESQEKKMMSKVDAVIVVSEKLYQAKQPFNANTYLVPNGVNYQAYTTALASSHIPGNLEVIPPPRLGYSGLISDRLNLGMLLEVAQKNPDWSLVFLGEAKVIIQAEIWQQLLTQPNVHYLGSVNVAEVPHYLKGLQVGLIPYNQDKQSDNLNPLKLYDYLASGLPVASIDIPAVRKFSDHIHIADTPQQFSEVVGAALADTTPQRHQTRRQVAAQHTWQARVEQISNLIEAQLNLKTNKKSTHYL